MNLPGSLLLWTGNNPGCGMGETSGRASAVDPLRMILALSVVALHTSFPEALPDLAKQMLVNGLYRLAVPVFAVISGYFFLNAIRNRREWAYLRRILTLYALWMAIYFPIWGSEVADGRNPALTVIFGYFHLWYLAGLVVAGVLVTALVRVGASPRVMTVVVIACAAVSLAGQYLAMTGRVQMALDAYRNGFFVIFPYFATGYLIALRKDRLPSLGLGVAAVALLAVMAESLIWYRIAGGMFGVDNMVSLMIAAPILFLVALRMPGSGNGKQIASMAAFIYFIHIMIMIAASALGLKGDIKAVAVMAASVGLALLLNASAMGRRLLSFIT